MFRGGGRGCGLNRVEGLPIHGIDRSGKKASSSGGSEPTTGNRGGGGAGGDGGGLRLREAATAHLAPFWVRKSIRENRCVEL